MKKQQKKCMQKEALPGPLFASAHRNVPRKPSFASGVKRPALHGHTIEKRWRIIRASRSRSRYSYCLGTAQIMTSGMAAELLRY